MKKMFIIICLCMFFCGCFDYKELNDCLIIAGVGIDKSDDGYLVTYEIMDTEKEEDFPSLKKNYVTGKGKTIAQAFHDVNLSLSKEPILSHIKVVILGEELARSGLKEVLSYFLFDPQIHNIFYPILAKGKAKDLMKDTPKISSSIQNMIDYNENLFSFVSKQTFTTFLDSILDEDVDGIMNMVSKENEQVVLSGLGLFYKDSLKAILEEKDASTLQILKNVSRSYLYKVQPSQHCYTLLNTSPRQNRNIQYQEDKIVFQTFLNASIDENNCDINFRDSKTYDDLERISAEELSKEFAALYNKLQTWKCDVLGIQKDYYMKTKMKLNDWYDYDIEFVSDVKVNKSGLLFEVKL